MNNDKDQVVDKTPKDKKPVPKKKRKFVPRVGTAITIYDSVYEITKVLKRGRFVAKKVNRK